MLRVTGNWPPQRSLSRKVQRRLAPVALLLRAVLDRGGDLVVAVAEDVGLDRDHVADHALDRRTGRRRARARPARSRRGSRRAPAGASRSPGRRRRASRAGAGRRASALPRKTRSCKGSSVIGWPGSKATGGACGRDVLELADPPADLAEQRPRIDPPGAARVRIDQDDRGVVGRRQVAAREAQEPDHRAGGAR